MSTMDNSKIFICGTFDDATVKVPAKTTYKAGTVLGLNSDGDLVAYSTDNDVAATSTTAAFVGEPTYILYNDITNDSVSAAAYPLSRVCVEGEVNKNKIIFINADDADDSKVLAAMKNNGFVLRNVQEACIG